ncbi:MAG: CDP-alcohol phosphatidyltransferase family protein [Pseudomonadota bacterium]
MNIPNLITLGRVILVPVIFWMLVNGMMEAAFIMFLIAGVSDAVDGFLAKRFRWETELGAYLDPLADKLLLVSVFIALGTAGHVPSWLVIAIVSRDILIVMGVLLARMLDHPIRIQPHTISKLNTVAQIILAALVLADEGFALNAASLRDGLIWVVGALTVLSLATYVRSFLAHMAGPAQSR